MPRYDAKRIEAKWQAYWERHGTFVTANRPPANSAGKLYVLDMFPYPSGDGLHVGHPEGYTATDIVCRYNRMRGKHVLHPMGWDAFGLPAEEHAIRTGTHPRITTDKNIETFRRQLKMLGFSYDWSREFATTDPDYYRWTQWIFLQLFDTWYDPDFVWIGPDGIERTGKGRPIAQLPIPEDVRSVLAPGESPGDDTAAIRRYRDAHRLAYQHEAPVNWCPALGTVLANEEVIDGKSERGGHPVQRIPLRQWMLRITAYADRLMNELAPLDWSESIKTLQRNWIGRSEGAEVDFLVDTLSRDAESSDRSADFNAWKAHRAQTSFPKTPETDVLRVYTTRPDTLYGVTYMVLAPEHPLVDAITTPEQKAAVDAYRQQASLKSDLDRTDLAKEKTGVFTGGYAINPVNGERVPVWIADYVLISYGTGAIMAVPAHDERDFEFAKQYGIEVKAVVAPSSAPGDSPGAKTVECYAGDGAAINSGPYTGLLTAEFKTKITADLAAAGLGRKAVNYRLRDWLFSRQRYWGEPFPIWHELDADGKPTGLMRTDAESELPVRLPDMADFQPAGTPEPLLSKAPDAWLYKTAADGVRLKRETNSMPQWAGSCWYYLRFADPKNAERFIDPAVEQYWLPVDLYIGGAEHAVLHLLYSRFWHKVLFDRGYVSTPEPFQRLVNQGMILGEMEFTAFRPVDRLPLSGASESPTFISAKDVDEGTLTTKLGAAVERVKLAAEDVEKKGEHFVLKSDPSIVVEARSYKMSKSRGNVINPDHIVAEYGADSLRMYEMFMGPLEAAKPWSMAGVDGVFRFLGRVWRLFADDRADDVVLNSAVQDVPPTPNQFRLLHKTIKAVTEDIQKLSFNTAISRMMEFTNEMTAADVRPRTLLEPFVLVLSPFAPHVAEELWELLGHPQSLAYAPWPGYDPALLVKSEIEVPVQVNGKLRGKVKVPADAEQSAIEAAGKSDAAVLPHLAGKTVVKTIYVPGRLLNFVAK
jgi:leucyl-tRNA synthetase